MLLMISMVAGSQASGQKKGKAIKATGTVTDINLLPVEGALIVVDGEGTAVTTNKKGAFRIRLNPDTHSVGVYTTTLGSAVTLFDGQDRFSFVLDGTEALVNFVPEAADGDMDIEIGYGTVKKKNLTTDVGYIDAQDDSNASYTNIYDMIQGKVPGVQVTGRKITIRGVNSINLSTDPLFVVDGIVVNSIDHISPSQVKSITVLKGSDAAIYGSRGAGGVIMITMLGTGR